MMLMLVRAKWAIRAITLQWRSAWVKSSDLPVSTYWRVSSQVTSSTVVFKTLSSVADRGITSRRQPWELRQSPDGCSAWMLTNSPMRWRYRPPMETHYLRFALDNFRMPKRWPMLLWPLKGRCAAYSHRVVPPDRYRSLKVKEASIRHFLPGPILTC